MADPIITITPKLKSYLEDKGLDSIVVDIAQASSCGGAIAEAYARVAKPAEAKRLAGEDHRCLQADGVSIYFLKRGLRCDEQVELGLRRILGLADVTCKGIHL